MAGDLTDLFEASARELRPAFRAALLALVDEGAPPPQLDDQAGRVGEASAARPDATVVPLAPRSRARRRPRRWHHGCLLLVAAALVAVAIGLARERARPLAEVALGLAGGCAPGRELGVVPTGDVDLRVTAQPGGVGFCLVDDATSLPVELVGLAPRAPEGPAPTLTSQAVVPGVAYVYTVALPPGLAVAAVASIGGVLPAFASPVERVLLVVDVRVPERGGVGKDHRVHLVSPAGAVLATLTPETARLDDLLPRAGRR